MSTKEDSSISYEAAVKQCSIIAQPLASKKLNKKLLKTVKKGTFFLTLASKSKCLKRGVKEVVKAIRKGQKGLVVLAGDISPIDVLSHLPVLCEDSGLPFVFTPSKAELGLAAQTKRPTSCVMIDSKSEEMKESYNECVTEIKGL